MVGTFSGVGLLTSEETGGGDGGSSLSWSFVGSGLASVRGSGLASVRGSGLASVRGSG